VFTLKPLEGGKVLVTVEKAMKSGQKRVLEVEVSNADVEAEAEKLGLGRPTPHTPVATDRVTA